MPNIRGDIWKNIQYFAKWLAIVVAAHIFSFGYPFADPNLCICMAARTSSWLLLLLKPPFVSPEMEVCNDSSQKHYVNLYYFLSSGMNSSGTEAKRTSPKDGNGNESAGFYHPKFMPINIKYAH